MTRKYLTPYGQEKHERFRQAWPLLLFWGPVAIVTLIMFGIADLICPDPPGERRNYQRGYRYHPPGA